jgi:ERCC4-type nuclease
MKLPAEIQPQSVIVGIDTREQTPLDVSPLKSVIVTMPTGDYGLVAFPDYVALERKSLSDLLGVIGQERERFEREVQRLLAYPVRALIVESTWPEIEAGEWRSKVTPAAAIGSLLGWIERGLPVIMCGDHGRAGRYVSRLLYTTARRRWRELRAMAQSIESSWEVTS